MEASRKRSEHPFISLIEPTPAQDALQQQAPKVPDEIREEGA